MSIARCSSFVRVLELVWRIAFSGFLLEALPSTYAQKAMAAATINDQISKLTADAQAALDNGKVLDAYDLAAHAALLGFRAHGVMDRTNIKTYNLVSEIASRLGQPAMSIVFALNAYTVAEAKLRSNDPLMGNVLRALGSAYGRTGDYASAKLFLESAVALHENALGSDAAEVATDLVATIQLYLQSSHTSDLVHVPRLLERAENIRVKLFGNASVEVADILRLYGETLAVTLPEAGTNSGIARQKALEAGELALNRAEAILKMYFAPLSYPLSLIYRTRGDLYTKAARFDEAFDAYGMALQASGDVPLAQDALRFAELAAKRNDVDLTLASCRAASAISYSQFQEFSRWFGISEKMQYRLHASPARQLCLSLIYGLNFPPKEKARALLDIEIRWRATATRSERERHEEFGKTTDAFTLKVVEQVRTEQRRLAEALINTIKMGVFSLNAFEEISDDLRRNEEVLALLTFSPRNSLGAPSASYHQLAKFLKADSAL
jgi:tetratricopeptide (TPR) repeat protein